MMQRRKTGPWLLGLLTAASLSGAASLGLLRPAGAHAQPLCANVACYLASGCNWTQGYTCWMVDRRTCTTQRCAFGG